MNELINNSMHSAVERKAGERTLISDETKRSRIESVGKVRFRYTVSAAGAVIIKDRLLIHMELLHGLGSRWILFSFWCG